MNRVPVRMVNWVNTGPVEDLGGLCTSENGNWVNTGPVTFRSAKLEIPQE